MTDLVHRAQAFATGAHAAIGQVRKYTGSPYIVHPANVVELVQSVQHDGPMLAAAWLHDVVEDTSVSIDLIADQFGQYVAMLVGWLTDVSKPADGNRATRKAMDLAHIAQAPADAQTIKLADLIDNAETIIALDPKFAKVFVPEMRQLLTVLHKGDASLMDRAIKVVTGE